MQLLNGPSRMESCNPLQKGQERYFSLAKKLLSHELIKMLALKPEGSQHALPCTFNGRRRLDSALEASAYPLLPEQPSCIPDQNRPIIMFIRPPSWQIKRNDHEGESLPQPELWAGIKPVLAVTITNTQISSHVGELRKISVRSNRIDLCSCYGAQRPEPETFR